MNQPPTAGRPTHEAILEAVGDIGDAKIAAIEATGATVEQFEEAAAWAAGESDVMGQTRIHPDPIVQAVYDILTAEDGPERDRE